MTTSLNDFIAPPWWKIGNTVSGTGWVDDYTRSRSAGADYTVDDIIGRSDAKKYTLTTDDIATVSGTPGTLLWS